MQGGKTHEQQLRTLERKDDMPDERRLADERQQVGRDAPMPRPNDGDARQSEFAVSRGGVNQESRDHNKHNRGGQEGHKPQQHSPAEEKH
ncbi:hypothetical protein [Flaviflagellibacter deserti]|uniref:Uncharacterized protein n=1 Tax=Flaviflagellibacter deserti TaxID=2267266 RepID=A0ABV9YWH2_9HYPH